MHIVDEYIVATEDLGESISNVIDLSDYLAELERQRADAINDVMSAYERESKVLRRQRTSSAGLPTRYATLIKSC